MRRIVRSILKISVFPLVLLTLSMCGQAQSSEPKTSDINAQEFHLMRDSLEHEQVLDVRTPGEWQNGIIPGAISINWYDASFEDQVLQLDKDDVVMIYCASGGRSKEAMQKLAKLGFKEIYNLKGGMNAWKRSNYEVDR